MSILMLESTPSAARPTPHIRKFEPAFKFGPTLLVGLYVIHNPKGYQASIKATVDGIHFCTWFMIGEKTLLSAAHCLQGDLRTVEIGISDKYKAACELPGEFGISRSLDLTLCLLDHAYVLPDVDRSRGDGFETVETRITALKEGKMVRFGGYGCHSPGAGVQQEYALGESRIYKLPPEAHLAGSPEPTPNLIKLRQAPSFLCDGDSGGPAFLFNDDAKTRSVIGVNSATATSIESGYVTSLLTADSRNFLSAWSQKHGQRICGIDAGAANCRAAR